MVGSSSMNNVESEYATVKYTLQYETFSFRRDKHPFQMK